MTCNDSGHVQGGNTVRLTAIFKDWGGDPIDPDAVKVLIYNREWAKISEYTLGPPNRTGVGNYYYDYVPAAVNTTLYVEWHGMIDGLPSLHRSALTVNRI